MPSDKLIVSFGKERFRKDSRMAVSLPLALYLIKENSPLRLKKGLFQKKIGTTKSGNKFQMPSQTNCAD